MKLTYKTSALLMHLLLAVLTIFALTSQTFAAGPASMAYQGRLTDVSGVPLSGEFTVTFAIHYDSVLAGSPLWVETLPVTCSDGLFSVALGELQPFPTYMFYEPALYLGITLEGESEMLPRKRLYSVPYAMRVGSLDGATGGTVTGQLVVSNQANDNLAISGAGGLAGGIFQAFQQSSSAVALTGLYSKFDVQVDAVGVKGGSAPSDGYGIGGDFTGGWYGVRSLAKIDNYSPSSHVGVKGSANGYAGNGAHIGIDGSAGGGVLNYGVKGYGYHNGTPGAYAYGIYGSAGYLDGYGAWAGYFDGWTTCNGTLEVLGTLTKPAGSFRIDHPLDPEHKYLQHSFVESPDMKNIYDGNVTTDANGEAVVTMPEWFSALNRDFCYQLTVLGQFAQAIVAEKLNGNRFSIKTDKPNVEVSWQVTGIRQDAYANAHRIEVEVAKKPQEVGLYIDPVAFGKGPERQVHYQMNKAAEDDRIANEARSKANEAKRSDSPDLPTPTKQ